MRKLKTNHQQPITKTRERHLLMRRLVLYLSVVLMGLVACQTADAPLPTLINLEATQTVEMSTAIALYTPTPLPPTATETPTSTPTITRTPTPVPPSLTPTPFSFQEGGTIYYVYNGDSIARVTADGLFSDIIVTFGVGQPIRDLTLSPDGELLAFVAPGGGSALEVHVANLDGTFVQRVSCLGFADVAMPTWSPDSQTLAFYAAPLPTDARGVYVADWVGAPECPSGNNQRQLAQTTSGFTGGFAWNDDGNRLFYSDGGMYVIDFVSSAVSQITLIGGFGADYDPIYLDDSSTLLYLRPKRDPGNGFEGGTLVDIPDALPGIDVQSPEGRDYFAQEMIISPSGEQLLLSTQLGVILLPRDLRGSQTIVRDLSITPSIAFSPLNDEIAYTDLGEDGVTPQIFAQDVNSIRPRQLTFNPEGSITDLVWSDTQPE